jgi:ABC-type polysaccharide/polyol phosphate export permease
MTTLIYDSAAPRTPLLTEFRNFWIYRGLIKLLVNRELTVRYKRSVLGIWWTLLNPLLTTGVMWLVFSVAFGSRFGDTGEPYVLYLLSGVLFITFFAQGLIATGSAITNSSSILSKVYVPPEVFAFATSFAGAANFLISLIPLLAAQLITGSGIPWTIVLTPLPIIAMLALVTGAGMLIAAAAVFFYDVLDLTRVMVQLLYYLTPVFYTIEFIPPRFTDWIRANPLFSYLEVFRDAMYRGVVSPSWEWAMMFGTAGLALGTGVWVFSKSWKNLVSTL